MKQHTIKESYSFSGKGLHTGVISNIIILPATEDYGICFQRVDIGDKAIIRALASNVTDVSYSTTLCENGASVSTVEHIMSALFGLGIDNALIQIDNIEVPILDGSAKPYVDAILKDGLIEQNAERQYFEIKEPYIHKDDKTDAEIIIEPSDHFEAHLLIDFNSSVVGVQEYSFNYDLNYSKEIAPCRTFCFFSQLEQLSAAGLIKGGDMENALVIVDNDPGEDQIKRIASLFNAGNIEVKKGYLSNVELHYDNECARHKMLDLIGDFALVGLPLKAKITAKKTGHRINTNVAKILLQNK